jgi:hypothetical protein
VRGSNRHVEMGLSGVRKFMESGTSWNTDLETPPASGRGPDVVLDQNPLNSLQPRARSTRSLRQFSTATTVGSFLEG